MTDLEPEIVQVRQGDGTWGVITYQHGGSGYKSEPCARCPWRRDAPIGAFPPEVFRYSARTTYDLSQHRFGCHSSRPSEPETYAGFLLRGASDNLSVRMSVLTGEFDPSEVSSSVDLYDNYREMAEANGVSPNDPALDGCRGDRARFEVPGSSDR